MENFVASQLRALAARNLRAKPLLLVSSPYVAKAGIRDDADSFGEGKP
ncbi:MAG: hypothetical protein WA555_07950 [Candidatus Sulfotelmatobacter sp.]